GPQHLTQVHELVRAEGICINAAPARVGPPRSFVARADAVSPVILVGEAPAGPAQDGYTQLFQRRDDVVAQSARVRDWRVLAHPEAPVYQAPQVFGKLSVDITIDDPFGLIGMNYQRGFIRFGILSLFAMRDGRV